MIFDIIGSIIVVIITLGILIIICFSTGALMTYIAVKVKMRVQKGMNDETYAQYIMQQNKAEERKRELNEKGVEESLHNVTDI